MNNLDINIQCFVEGLMFCFLSKINLSITNNEIVFYSYRTHSVIMLSQIAQNLDPLHLVLTCSILVAHLLEHSKLNLNPIPHNLHRQPSQKQQIL